MKDFAQLYAWLDETNKTNEKVEALVHYFRSARPADAAWAVYFLAGRKPRQAVSGRKLSSWALARSGLPAWFFDECHEAVGDLAETIALLLPLPSRTHDRPLHEWVEEILLPLRDWDESRQKEMVLDAWGQMDHREILVWNKLITGGFRVGVSQQLVTRALAKFSGTDQAVLAHRLMGNWKPSAEFFEHLLTPQSPSTDPGQPYPFFLAYPLEEAPESLGPLEDWQVEWKWDGIRAQMIRRGGQGFLWTRGEELVTDRYPEFDRLFRLLPDGTVLDGELLPWKNGEPLGFAQLQRRLGRKTPGKKLLDEIPVLFMAYDLLEWQGQDFRTEPLHRRRTILEDLLGGSAVPGRLELSPLVPGTSWDELGRLRLKSRERLVEGLMLKRRNSPYGVGRQRGDWWKWKIDPLTLDAVLMYAQAGHGRRASLFTDYTFGVWDQGRLVRASCN